MRASRLIYFAWLPMIICGLLAIAAAHTLANQAPSSVPIIAVSDPKGAEQPVPIKPIQTKRAIFSRQAAPLNALNASSAPSQPVSPPVSQAPLSLKLIGIVSDASGTQGVFLLPSGETIKLSRWQSHDGWSVERIGDNFAKLTRGDESRLLRLYVDE